MSLVAPVEDGKIVDTSSVTSSVSEKSSSGSSLDKDAFLQLLVAQMKYQDPLEPTSNTEYISQLATFSSLEEMQNLNATMQLQRASILVGQEVYIKTTNKTTGVSDYIHGNVDYVQYENNKAYVSVGGNLYPIDDVDSVYDRDYTTAYSLAYDWTVGLNKLPALSKLTLSDEADVTALKNIYDNMTDYQKTFLTKDNISKLQDYVDRIEILKEIAQELEEKLDTDAAEDTKDTDTDDEKETEAAEETSDEAEETIASGVVEETKEQDTESEDTESGDTVEGTE